VEPIGWTGIDVTYKVNVPLFAFAAKLFLASPPTGRLGSIFMNSLVRPGENDVMRVGFSPLPLPWAPGCWSGLRYIRIVRELNCKRLV
jgi:hypothetical protein